jgi:hypothetical protein
LRNQWALFFVISKMMFLFSLRRLLDSPINGQMILTIIAPLAIDIGAFMGLRTGKTDRGTFKVLNRTDDFCFRCRVGNIVDAKLVSLP